MEKGELTDILVSVIAISIAFSIRGLLIGMSPNVRIFPIVLVTVGLGFVLHELAHRFVAKMYGAVAFYRGWQGGLMLMLLTSLFGFIIAAPGAVYIYSPYLTRKQNGIISLAGPLTNFLLAILFLVVGVMIGIGVTSAAGETLAEQFLLYGFATNMYLGFLNMLPIPPLDGSKVFSWNFAVWAVVFLVFLLPMLFLEIL
jgi:Zn-dependent protease